MGIIPENPFLVELKYQFLVNIMGNVAPSAMLFSREIICIIFGLSTGYWLLWTFDVVKPRARTWFIPISLAIILYAQGILLIGIFHEVGFTLTLIAGFLAFLGLIILEVSKKTNKTN